MKKVDRKIIFECRVGSHLYGTNRPDSDEDFLGVFMPSSDDLLGLENAPSEWSMNEKNSTGDRNTIGDTDRKYFSLKKFLNLLSEGQSGPVELLFAPRDLWIQFSPEWQKILENRHLFISQNSIKPFIGFATAQAHKATLKGNNLNLVREMILWLDSEVKYATLESVVTRANGRITSIRAEENVYELKYVITDGGTDAIEIAGRQYELTQQVRYVLQKLKRIEQRYGTRSEAAAEHGYDYKSLTHAYRLLFQAKELLATGKISLPRPMAERAFLTKVRSGTYQADYFQEIQDQMTEIRSVISDLPKEVDHGKISELCKEMTYKHIFGE